jgi:hypothetical protein
MKPVEFPEHNTVFAKDQPEYLPLPAYRESANGMVTTCWELTWKERFAMLFGGKLWLQQLTFNKPLQPQRPSIVKPI